MPTSATPDLYRYAVSVKPRGERERRIGITEGGRIRWWKDDAGYRGHLTTHELLLVDRWATKRFDGRYKLTTHRVALYPNLVGDLDCDAELLRRLQRVAERLSKKHGRRITIRVASGRRRLEEQQALWDRNMNPDGTVKPGRPLTARPNPNAPHVRGVAADCHVDGMNIGSFPGARAAMRAEDVVLNVASESWHAQVEDKAAGVIWRNKPIPRKAKP